MRCALISDVHANKYALGAVIDSIKGHGADVVLNAGDSFGYYPWAQEVFELLQPLATYSVLGNHDALIRGPSRPDPLPSYWDAVEQNRQHLAPAGLEWLSRLPSDLRIELKGRPVRVVHGTPDELLTGRLYPDHAGPTPEWFPAEGEVLVLGHTHYPMAREAAGRRTVAQPRVSGPTA